MNYEENSMLGSFMTIIWGEPFRVGKLASVSLRVKFRLLNINNVYFFSIFPKPKFENRSSLRFAP
jgi:hypothetical protein